MDGSIFRKTSLERISSPEELNDYIRVSNPSVWVALGALLVLACAALVWGFAGSLPSAVSATGVSSGGAAVCYLPPEAAARVAPGMEARSGDYVGAVEAVGALPLSREEAAQGVDGDYLRSSLGLSDWNVPVTVSLPGAPEGVLPLSIVTESVRPIDLILN